MAAFPSLCAPQKVQSGSAADWRSPTTDDQEGGDPATYGGAGDPANEKEQCVGTCGHALEKGWHTGAVELLRYAAW